MAHQMSQNTWIHRERSNRHKLLSPQKGDRGMQSLRCSISKSASVSFTHFIRFLRTIRVD